MDEQTKRMDDLERAIRYLAVGLVLSLFVAAVSLLAPLRPAAAADHESVDELVLSGEIRLERIGPDLRITLPESRSGIVLQTPDGTEIARLGAPIPRSLGE